MKRRRNGGRPAKIAPLSLRGQLFRSFLSLHSAPLPPPLAKYGFGAGYKGGVGGPLSVSGAEGKRKEEEGVLLSRGGEGGSAKLARLIRLDLLPTSSPSHTTLLLFSPLRLSNFGARKALLPSTQFVATASTRYSRKKKWGGNCDSCGVRYRERGIRTVVVCQGIKEVVRRPGFDEAPYN